MQGSSSLPFPNHKRPMKPFLSRCEKGVFYIHFTNPDTGKRTKISTHTKIRSQAELALSHFMKSQSSELIQRCLPKNVKISDLLDLILKAFSSRKSQNTLSLYQLAFKQLIRIMGNKQIISITRFDADYFINSLISGKLQWTSINIYTRHIKSAFSIALSYGLIEDNPFKQIQQLTVPDWIRPVPSNAELLILLKSVLDTFMLRIVKFALLTAMRRSEIVNLQWKDIDFEGRKIHVRCKEDFKTKTRKNREIPLTEAISKVLKAPAFENQTNIFLLRDQNSYVFGKENGFRITPNCITHKFKKLVRLAGLDDKICFHVLRHVALSQMAISGMPIHMIKEIAGHSSISTTQKYLHCNTETMGQFLREVDYGF